MRLLKTHFFYTPILDCEKSTEMIELVTRPVVGADDESVVVHVEDEVLTHHGQPDQGDIGHRLDLLNHLHRRVT